jgi:hypothetical protein
VLRVDKTQERDARGRVLVGPDGKPRAPLWSVLSISGLDIVRTGDATTRLLLSAGADDDAALRARSASRKAAWARAEAQQGDDDVRLRWKNKKRKLGLV